MNCSLVNTTGEKMDNVEKVFNDYFPYAEKKMGFDKPVTVYLVSNPENGKNVFGKTAFYDPQSMEITIYIDGRHPKDMLRSLSHELVHHTQNCRGEFAEDKMGETGLGYAQTNPHMRNMEAEAYLDGNMCFRDYGDVQKRSFQEGVKKMKKVSMKKLKETIKEAVKKALDKKEVVEAGEEEGEVVEEVEDVDETEETTKEWKTRTLNENLMKKLVK